MTTLATTLSEAETTFAVAPATREAVHGAPISVRGLSAWYGRTQAVKDVSLEIAARSVTAIIGPSGCGKSTLLRTLNRMHETQRGARVEGSVEIAGVDLYGPGIDPVQVRRAVGMVFQKPNPFPGMSIRENVAAGPRVLGLARGRRHLDEIVETSLRRAALWDEVKDILGRPGLSLSGGQQQRLCIARTIAVDPEVVLMDEPCSALDPLATLRIEELIAELKQRYTIVIVTHNMQQAARVSSTTAFMSLGEDRTGQLIEVGETQSIFTSPTKSVTSDYISGRFG